MTPQELLKDIESKNYEWSSEDVKWLIARVKQLQSENTHLKEQIRIAKDALEKIHNRYVQCEDCMARENIAGQALSQLTDKRESENVLVQLNEKKESK